MPEAVELATSPETLPAVPTPLVTGADGLAAEALKMLVASCASRSLSLVVASLSLLVRPDTLLSMAEVALGVAIAPSLSLGDTEPLPEDPSRLDTSSSSWARVDGPRSR